MLRGKIIVVLVLVAAAGLASPFARAQDPNIHARAASLLIFPLFDSRPDRGTLIAVTNTDTSRIPCPGFFLSGEICVHYNYIAFSEEAGICLEFDRVECLTPGDTLTVIADQHNPEQDQGWLWVEALDVNTLEPITHNALIGSAIIVESDLDFVWSYTPYAFRSVVEPPCDNRPCGEIDRCVTEVDDEMDADFDGVEFVPFPDDLLLDMFFQEADPEMKNILNELTLMSTETLEQTITSFLIWNNSEVVFSRGFVFDCFFRGPLSEVSDVVLDLGGTDDERFQTGWARIRSADGILGVFKHQKGRFGAGHELIADGTQDPPVSIRRFPLQ